MASTATWIVQFKHRFPEFAEIKDEDGNDVTDAAITKYLYLAMNMLPQGMIEYFTRCRLSHLMEYMVAHLLQYFDVLNSYDQTKKLVKNTASMSADGLAISYTEVAKLRGDMFPSLNDFCNTTAYGRVVAVYLNQMVGTTGGFVV